MIWYILFSFFVIVIVAVICDADDTKPGISFLIGVLLGSLSVIGLVLQYGTLLR